MLPLAALGSLSDISLTSWAGIMAAGALLTTCWRYVRMAIGWFVDLFICKVALKDETARAVLAHVWSRGVPSPFGTRVFGGITTFVAPKRRIEAVAYEGVMSDPRLFWCGRTPILVKCGFGGGNDSPNIGYSSGNAMPAMIWFIRGTLSVDELLTDAITTFNRVRQDHETTEISKRRVKRFNVIRMHGKGAGHDGVNVLSTSKSPEVALGNNSGNTDEILSQLRRGEVRTLIWRPEDLTERPAEETPPFLCHPVPETIMRSFEEIDIWLKSEKWFRQRGCPWYRGYLLYGPSGSGKSTIVRNLALRHDLPIYTFDLSTYDNQQFTADWRAVMQNAPAIALLEDLDCTFCLRENLATKGKQREGLTFDCLLNTISGVGSSDGVLLFVTTNHLESLDPALGIPDNGHGRSTRPGRINRAIHVGPMGEPERLKLATMILSDDTDLIEATVATGEGEMAAQFQERCAQLALARWNGRNAKGA